MFHNPHAFKVVHLSHHLSTEEYIHKTQEVVRVDCQTIKEFPLHKWSELALWRDKVSLHHTKHLLMDRLRPYINRPSMRGTYCELTGQEFNWIFYSDCTKWLTTTGCRLVEVGWNQDDEICKVAYVKEIPPLVHQLPGSRFLFFCVGMDGGVKTAYVTPYLKYKDHYHGPVPYWKFPKPFFSPLRL